LVCIDTPQEALYYADGAYVLRQLLAGKPETVVTVEL
jgi:hypothetical protein